MRRIMMLGAMLPLAACATNEGKLPAPGFHGVCVDGPGQAYLGQPATAETGTNIMFETGATVLRWAAPGQMMTMDMRPDRVTVTYGPDMKVTKISCG